VISQHPKTKRTRLAVLVTSYNRKDKTTECLRALYDQDLAPDIDLAVYLVDDASTDGTSEAVRSQFPAVHIIAGSGSLYWCGGMRLAWQQACHERYDYFLWLNDDTLLRPGAIQLLLNTDRNGRTIVAGSCCDPITGHHTYGGRIRKNTHVKLPNKPIPPSEKAIPCDTMNGNIVLVPSSVVNTIGILSSEYSHVMGDTDYGLRAQEAGIEILVAPGYLGTCARHGTVSPWTDPRIRLHQRLQSMCEPKGFPPREWYVYVRSHTGYRWPIYFIKPLVRVIFPSWWSATY